MDPVDWRIRECRRGVAIVAWFLSKNGSVVETILQSPVPAAFAPIPLQSDDQYEALRERYRSLRTEYRDLERSTHASKSVASLAEWRFDADRTISTLAKALKEVARVKGAALFVVPDARDGFTLAGSYASPITEECTLPVSLQASPIVMRDSAERIIRSLNEGPTTRLATVILTDRGRLVGLAALFDDDRSVLEAGIDAVQNVAQFVANVLQDEHVTQRLRERVAQLELLNRFAGRTSDGTDRETATGICEDVAAELGLDGCAIVDLTGVEPKPLGCLGDSVTEILGFPGGPDLRGWMGAGAQEVVIDDARKDERCDEVAALRRGIGAMMVQPLISSGSLIGAVVSWTAKRRGISSIAMSTLRALSPHVIRQVFGGFAGTKPGIVDANTFWHGTQGPGRFVEIDLGRTTAAEAPKALQEARRLLITTAMGRLPQGGLITRRSAGTLLAFLPGYDELAASRWAEALRPHAHEQWEMRVDGRGQSQQSRQFFERLSA